MCFVFMHPPSPAERHLQIASSTTTMSLTNSSSNLHDDSDAATMSSGKVRISSTLCSLLLILVLAGREAFREKSRLRSVSRKEGTVVPAEGNSPNMVLTQSSGTVRKGETDLSELHRMENPMHLFRAPET